MKDNLSAYSSNDYDSRVSSVLPYYSEFHNQVLDLAESLDLEKINWLDTGCGTGSLALKALSKFKLSEFVLCDPSADMIEKAKSKLSGFDNVSFYNLSSQQLDFKNRFDIVTAIQSHHYLNEEQRALATKKCFDALKSGGVYVTFENIELSSEMSIKIGINRWKRFLISNGKNEEEVQSHINRRGTEVFPITVEEHIKLIKDCGFRTVDVLWASYMQAGFFAVK